MCLFSFLQRSFFYIVLCLDFCTNKPADFDSGMCDIRHHLSEEKIIITSDAVCERLLKRSIRTGAL